MNTFHVQTLGCKVNQYESEQIATLLRARGLKETSADQAELRIINTCSVTVQAASQSRQAIRRMARENPSSNQPDHPPQSKARVLVVGCWATSDRSEAAALNGVDAVLTHQDNLDVELDRLLTLWQMPSGPDPEASARLHTGADASPPWSSMDDGWMKKTQAAAGSFTSVNKTESPSKVNEIPASAHACDARPAGSSGARSLPLLGQRVTGRQRAFLKVQDGCDAHCTYCIIPRLRPALWSKPVEDAVEEARRLVDAGHVEIVLTGIFLGAYGQATALRRRQPARILPPLAELIEALCKKVPGLQRLRLSSLEPGDLTHELLSVLASHRQVVPHFHLPLQSGSDAVLRRMNRQYSRDDFLRMIDEVNAAFDRPALTTDIIVGFPGEGDEQFQETVEVVHRARFIHIHAFPFSPRPGTAAARWDDQFVRGPVVNERIELLTQCATRHSLDFRSQFLGHEATVIAETARPGAPASGLRQGRCERYFSIWFDGPEVKTGESVRVRIDQVTPTRTLGRMIGHEEASA